MGIKILYTSIHGYALDYYPLINENVYGPSMECPSILEKRQGALGQRGAVVETSRCSNDRRDLPSQFGKLWG